MPLTARHTLLAVVVLLYGCAPPDTDPVQESEVTTTVASRALTLSDFNTFPKSDPSWSGGDVIACSGETKGYIYTRDAFDVGTIRMEYRFPEQPDAESIPNTGLLLLIESPHKTWPRCIEAQGKQSEAGQLKGNGGVTDLAVELDEAALATAIRPPGEWNAVEVEVTASEVIARWNGTITARCSRGGLPAGAFGVQSEGNRVEFRALSFEPSSE